MSLPSPALTEGLGPATAQGQGRTLGTIASDCRSLSPASEMSDTRALWDIDGFEHILSDDESEGEMVERCRTCGAPCEPKDYNEIGPSDNKQDDTAEVRKLSAASISQSLEEFYPQTSKEPAHSFGDEEVGLKGEIYDSEGFLTESANCGQSSASEVEQNSLVDLNELQTVDDILRAFKGHELLFEMAKAFFEED